ncbi:aldo/keto reductase [Micromonospora sp. NPDC047074]|uniref:aldo/keto reductase n=1 Tax=Micromonospora sp. NPDC047074 TaxID=3154339 RepID=UPI0033EC088D
MAGGRDRPEAELNGVRYRCLGHSGLRVSVLGLGCSHLGTRLDATGTERLVRAAVHAGVVLFDTADVYGKGASEEALGRALTGLRDEVVIATKGRWAVGRGPNHRGASRIHLRRAVEASLRRLGTDHIDLYQIHAPDPNTPIEETVEAIDELVRSGKIRYAGTSNFAGWQLVDAHWHAHSSRRTRLVSTQAPYNLLDHTVERDVLPAAQHCRLGFIACLVLARGFLAAGPDTARDPATLTAKQRAYLTEENILRRSVLARFAAERGLSPADVALAAIVDRPGVSAVLAGASDPQQLAANVAAVGQGLSAADAALLRADLAAVSLPG